MSNEELAREATIRIADYLREVGSAIAQDEYPEVERIILETFARSGDVPNEMSLGITAEGAAV
jgi:hypothetical protein